MSIPVPRELDVDLTAVPRHWMAGAAVPTAVSNGINLLFPHGERFIVHMKYDVTPTSGPHKGKRMQLDEAGLYTVRDGKIVQEEFFYDM